MRCVTFTQPESGSMPCTLSYIQLIINRLRDSTQPRKTVHPLSSETAEFLTTRSGSATCQHFPTRGRFR